MINTHFNIKKAFREQVTKFINTTFGGITPPHIRTTLAKNKTRVSRYCFMRQDQILIKLSDF